MKTSTILSCSILLVSSLASFRCDDAIGDAGTDSDASSDDGIGLVLKICNVLVERGFVQKCGTQELPCGEPAEPGCVQLYDENVVVNPDGVINSDTQDMPRDLVALFEMIDFLPPEAIDTITPTGVITWGNPDAEGEPFVVIDQEKGEYRIDSGQSSNAIDPVDEALDESYYEQDVLRYLVPMGVDQLQKETTISAILEDIGDEDGNIITKLYQRTAEIQRIINQVCATTESLVFAFSPDDGHLLRISGRWSPINYANSQFLLNYTSIETLVDDMVAMLQVQAVTPDRIVSLMLKYAVKNDSSSKTLDLQLAVGANITEYDMDI